MNTLVREREIAAVAGFCRDELDLTNAILYGEYNYRSLPLCVIDSIFSINANYASTENTVARFCRFFDLQQSSHIQPPPLEDQLSIAEFLQYYRQYGADAMAIEAYQNRQRTSTRSGILKSEAVLLFSKELFHFGVNYFQDVSQVINNPSFEASIMKIPGQGSGLSLRYFYMLAGSDDFIKPDRMITRFVEYAIGRTPTMQESHDLIVAACDKLKLEFPRLTPRVLDNLIWQYQRAQ